MVSLPEVGKRVWSMDRVLVSARENRDISGIRYICNENYITILQTDSEQNMLGMFQKQAETKCIKKIDHFITSCLFYTSINVNIC